MATLRSTTSFTESVVYEDDRYVEKKYTLEGSKLISTLSTRTMTYKESDIVFSFESLADINNHRLRVTVDLMKKGIVISTSRPHLLGASRLNKIYYYAFIGDEASFSNLRGVGANIAYYLSSFNSIELISHIINNYKEISLGTLQEAVVTEKYLSTLFSHSTDRILYRLNEDGGYANTYRGGTLLERITIKPEKQRFVGLFMFTALSSEFRRIVTGYSGDCSSNFFAIGTNGISIKTRTSRWYPGARTELVEHITLFEMPIVTGLSRSSLVNKFFSLYGFKKRNIDLETFAYCSEPESGETYKFFNSQGMGNNFENIIPSFRSDAKKYKVAYCEYEIGEAIKTTSSRYLVSLSIERLVDLIGDDEEIDWLDDEGYDYLIFVVNHPNDIINLLPDYLIYAGEEKISRILQNLAVSSVWKHFKEKF